MKEWQRYAIVIVVFAAMTLFVVKMFPWPPLTRPTSIMPVMPANHRIQAEHIETVADMKPGDHRWVSASSISYKKRDGTSWLGADSMVFKKPEDATAHEPTLMVPDPEALVPIVADKDGIYAVCFDHKLIFATLETYQQDPTNYRRWIPLRIRDSSPGEKPGTITWEPPKIKK